MVQRLLENLGQRKALLTLHPESNGFETQMVEAEAG